MNIIEATVNIIFYLGVFINAALFIPQAVKIFKQRSAKGLSLITFGGYNILQTLAILHGYFHHDLKLMIGMILSLITCGCITFGILYYRIKRTGS